MIGRAPKLRYGYASGRVGVLRTRLISRARFHRIIAGENLAEIMTVLSETVYGGGPRDITDLEGLENLVAEELAETYRLLEDSNLPPDMSVWFRSRHDFVNLRALLKSGFGEELDVRLSSLGTVSASTIETLVKTRSFSGFPPTLAAAAEAAVTVFNETKNSETIDIVLDRHHFAQLLSLAERIKSVWVLDYTRLLVDLANARIVFRSQAEGRSLSYIASRLISGGRVAEGDWEVAAAAGTVMNQLLKVLPPRASGLRLVGGDTHSLPVSEFDLFADAVSRSYLSDAQMTAFGPEPVFAYIADHELETKLLRLIVIGRVNGVSADILQHRVDSTYE